MSRNAELKSLGAYQTQQEKTELIQRVSKIIVSKNDSQLDIDMDVFQKPPVNSKQPLFIAGDCLHDTLILCGVDKDQADMARRAFVSLRENI